VDAVFDSNILIDYLNGIPEAKLELERYSQKSISVMTWIEVMAGTDSSDEQQTRYALQAYQLLPMTSAIAERAFILRRDCKLKLPDAIILATAQVAGLSFVTRNTKDFSAADPQVRIPYQILPL
jgi:predicted nucleic acid-binding protein